MARRDGMPRLESILLHSARGDGYNDLTPLSAIRRGPGAMTGKNPAEARLREKLRKIEALFADAGTAGEKAAAGAAADRIKEVYNGDIGYIDDVDPEAGELTASFDGRAVAYGFADAYHGHGHDRCRLTSLFSSRIHDCINCRSVGTRLACVPISVEDAAASTLVLSAMISAFNASPSTLSRLMASPFVPSSTSWLVVLFLSSSMMISRRRVDIAKSARSRSLSARISSTAAGRLLAAVRSVAPRGRERGA